MKFSLAIVSLLLVVTSVLAQATDNSYQPDDHMDMFLMVFGLSAAFIMMAITALGAAIFLAIIGVIVLLVFTGLVSASVFAGVLSRSWSTGLKAFLYLACITLGVAGGIPFAFLTASLFDLLSSGWEMFFLGAVSGAVGGVVLAWLILFAFKRIGRYLNKSTYVATPKS